MEPGEHFETSDNFIPIFPLPTTVFYPQTPLPLHIFEPRYRQMVSDTLEGNRKIGMVLLRPGWEAGYHGRPDIASVGCVGKIDRHVRLPDGKYNILLKGLSRFRIIKEKKGKLYRQAQIQLLAEINDQDLGTNSHTIKEDLINHFREFTKMLPEDHRSKPDLDFKTFSKLSAVVDNIVYGFEPSAEKKQNFLEEQDVTRRMENLHSLLDLKIEIIKLSKLNIKKGTDVGMN